MEQYRFFNSADGDERLYLASEFAEYFSRFLSDGVYTENGQAGLKVIPGEDMTVATQSGFAFIRGYLYKNDSDLSKTLDGSDSILERIDRVVLRFDEVARTINITIKKGTLASSPQIPVLEITSTVKELALAQVKIRKGAAAILASDITDERMTDACGQVSSLITIPVQEMWDAWNGSLIEIQDSWQVWFSTIQNNLGLRVMAGSVEPTDKAARDIWLKEV